MFQKLKISSAKKYIENSIYDHRPKAVRQIDKLGVILDEKVLNKIAYDQLKKAFSSLGKKVEMILFSDKAEEGELSFKRSDLGWKGVFKTKSLKDFSATPFDILISYYTPENLSLKAMTALSAAKFKVGIDPAMETYNDLTIHVATGQEVVFTKELEKYLKILKVIN